VADWVAAHGLSDGLRLALQQIARQRRELLVQTREHVRRMLEQDCEGRLQQALHGQPDETPTPQVAG
jgi:hypothetical protein